MLDTVTYSEFRSHLGGYIEKICAQSAPLRVTLKNGKNLLVSVDAPKKTRKKKKMDETEYLLSSPANAKMLMDAINSDPKKRKTYRSVDEIREEFGIK